MQDNYDDPYKLTPAEKAFVVLANIIVETVKEAGPNGAPSGLMYAALMDKINLDVYERIMSLLIEVGRLRKQGHVYYYMERKKP